VGKLVKGLIPLGGIFVSHDWIGHMEYDKRGFDIILERAGQGLPSELEENSALWVLAVGIRKTFLYIESTQREKTELESQVERLGSQHDALVVQINDLGGHIESADDIREFERLNAALRMKETLITQKRSLIASCEDKIHQYYNILYGGPFGKADYLDKPADVTEWIRALYRIHWGIDKEPTGPYADEVNYVLRTSTTYEGLYYQLFVAHVRTFGGAYSDWAIDESGTFVMNVRGRSPIPYYIKQVT